MSGRIKPISPIRPGKQILRDARQGTEILGSKPKKVSETLPPAVKVSSNTTKPSVTYPNPKKKPR